MKRVGLSFLLIITSFYSFAQKNEDWYNLDFGQDGELGVSVNKAKELVKGKKAKEVIVAVIDSGVDIDHEDLKQNIWINTDEIPDNGIDDDQNGYIDDIYGWNFLGGKDGNVVEELYETTRIYKRLKPKYDGKSASEISASDKKEYQLYLETKKETEKKIKQTSEKVEEIRGIQNYLSTIQSILEPILLDKELTKENVMAINPSSERVKAAKEAKLQLYKDGFDDENFKEYAKYWKNRLLYHYNLEFDPRKVVGDNPEDPYETGYGNNDVFGGHAEHGTHVAGIIGAARDNGEGINGVAHNVKLMVLRAVPDGDERDKDIANAIIYAVDNGARVINMSFGKGHSPNKAAVDKAVKYAEQNNVLMINSAGNASINIDNISQFPNKHFDSTETTEAKNWITVGASNREKGLMLTADFSNYGQENVDIFAPGVDIYSTIPEGKYKENSGTSMAAPVVSGVAALVLNYFPDLSAEELREVLLKSAINLKKTKVYLPTDSESKKRTKFKKLSETGGVVNAYQALKYAEKISG